MDMILSSFPDYLFGNDILLVCYTTVRIYVPLLSLLLEASNRLRVARIALQFTYSWYGKDSVFWNLLVSMALLGSVVTPSHSLIFPPPLSLSLSLVEWRTVK